MKRIIAIGVAIYITALLTVGAVTFADVQEVQKTIRRPDLLPLSALRRDVSALDLLTARVFHPTYIKLARETLDVADAGTAFLQVAQTYAQEVLTGKSENITKRSSAFTTTFDALQTALTLWENDIKKYPYINTKIQQTFPQLQNISLEEYTDVVRALPAALGPDKKQYIVLLQNNMELRPTGGFLGSFALLTFENGVLSSMKVEDIYVPDGQLDGYVKPPEPVETNLFQGGGWKLRDANWDPHFPNTAQTLKWFFEKGGYTNIDGMIATNFSVVARVLETLGPITLPDFDQTITADNLYSFAQVQTETRFFPGATNKGTILGSLARALLRKTEDLSLESQKTLAVLARDAIASKDIMFWFADPPLQRVASKYKWAGEIESIQCEGANCFTDNLYLVEANVGINKTNCCMERKAYYDVWINENGTIRSELKLHYINHNPSTPAPPRFYGGGYRNYLRIYRSAHMQLVSAEQRNQSISPQRIDSTAHSELNLRDDGMIVDVGGGEETDFRAAYVSTIPLDLSTQGTYVLLVQKQPGLLTNDYVIRLHYPPTLRVATQGADITEPGFIELAKTVDKNTTIVFTFQLK